MIKYLFLLIAFALPSLALQRAQGWCEQGGKTIVGAPAVGQAPVTRGFQQSYKNCTVTVYAAGTVTLATIYSTSTGTALANPFTADQYGLWYFYASNGNYDVQISGGGPPALAAPYTFGDIQLFDPARIILSVLSFGAKCDGAADDAQAIQNAINSVHTAGGGTVTFPFGTCLVASSATGKGAGVTTALQKYSDVSLAGATGGNTSGTACASAIGFSPTSGTLLAAGDTLANPRSSISNLCLIGPGTSNTSNAILLGGDPAATLTPANFESAQLILTNTQFTLWNTGVTYGNNSFLTEYHATSFVTNNTGISYPTGITNSGETERFYGGLFSGNLTAGINSAASGNFTTFATNMEFNGIAIEQSAGIGQVIIYGNHFEGNGAVYYAVAGAGMFPRVTVYGGDVNATACANTAYFQVSGTNSPYLGIYDLAQSLAGTDSCPLISADAVVNPTFASIVITNVLKGTQNLITTSTNVFNVKVTYLGQECISCDTTGTGGSLTNPGIQINSNPSTPSGLWFGPQTAINSAADWSLVRGLASATASAIENGLQHVFSNVVQLPGGILNSATLSGAPGSEFDYFIQHTGTISPTNLQFAHSIRANNTDYILYGNDGSANWNMLNFVYSDKTVRLADDFFSVNSSTGAIKTAGAAGLSTSATGGTCTLTFTNGLLTTKGGGC